MSAEVNLTDVNVEFALSGGADFGVDALANALTTGIKADVGLANIGITANGAVDVGLGDVHADIGLGDIRLKELPTIRTDSKVDLGLDDIRIAELPPIRLEFSMRPIRIHLPVNYSFCLEVFGIRLFKFAVCGEGMAVTEDYKPHATERCG